MKIYKYVSTEIALKILETDKIKVSKASDFNDPFEFTPRDLNFFKNTKTRQRLLRKDEHIRPYYENFGRKAGYTNFKKFKREIQRNPDLVNKHIPDTLEERITDTETVFRTTADRVFRIFCASETNTEILLWSHYADNHKGAVICFEDSHPPFSQLPSLCKQKANYVPDRISFEYNPLNEKDYTKKLLKFLATKYEAWNYEKEIRYFFPTDAVSEQGLIQLGEHAIHSVFFGLRNVEDKATTLKLRALMPKLADRNILLFKAKLHKHKYAVEFVPYNPI
jgi:hypothetical protein